MTCNVEHNFREILAGIDVEKNKKIVFDQYKDLVYHLAHKCTVQLELDDLVQNGFIGLLRAIELYDVDAGATFMSYAHRSIRNTMYREGNAQRNMVYIPVNRVEDGVRLSKYLNAKTRELGYPYVLRHSDYPVVAKELGLPVDTIEQLHLQIHHGNHTGPTACVSLDASIGDSDDTNDILLAEVSALVPPHRAHLVEEQDTQILAALWKLHNADQALISNWFGIGCEIRTLDEMVDMVLVDRMGVPIKSKGTMHRRCKEALERFRAEVKRIGVDFDELLD